MVGIARSRPPAVRQGAAAAWANRSGLPLLPPGKATDHGVTWQITVCFSKPCSVESVRVRPGGIYRVPNKRACLSSGNTAR